MKRLKLFTLLAVFAATLTGCTEDYYGAQVFTHEYTITPADWTRNTGELNPGADNYLYATFENQDITPDVMREGTVTADVWAIYNAQQNLGSWHPLPYVYPFEYRNDDGTIDVFSENIRLEWELGKVTFIIQELGGWDPENLNNTLAIRVNVTKNVLL